MHPANAPGPIATLQAEHACTLLCRPIATLPGEQLCTQLNVPIATLLPEQHPMSIQHPIAIPPILTLHALNPIAIPAVPLL